MKNKLFTISTTPRNAGYEQFPGGQVGAVLIDNNGRIVELIGTRNRSAINAGSLSGANDKRGTYEIEIRRYRNLNNFRSVLG